MIGRAEGLKYGQTLFYRMITATAMGAIKISHQPFYTINNSRCINEGKPKQKFHKNMHFAYLNIHNLYVHLIAKSWICYYLFN